MLRIFNIGYLQKPLAWLSKNFNKDTLPSLSEQTLNFHKLCMDYKLLMGEEYGTI